MLSIFNKQQNRITFFANTIKTINQQESLEQKYKNLFSIFDKFKSDYLPQELISDYWSNYRIRENVNAFLTILYNNKNVELLQKLDFEEMFKHIITLLQNDKIIPNIVLQDNLDYVYTLILSFDKAYKAELKQKEIDLAMAEDIKKALLEIDLDELEEGEIPSQKLKIPKTSIIRRQGYTTNPVVFTKPKLLILDKTNDYFRTQINPPQPSLVYSGISLLSKFPENAYTTDKGQVLPILNDGITSATTITNSFLYPNHWGQRKLLFTEIDFLTNALSDIEFKESWLPKLKQERKESESEQKQFFKSDIPKFNKDIIYDVVYAGAAPGTHILFLLKLFPNLRFHLYDPRPFDPELYKRPDRIIINEYYVDKPRDNTYGYFTNKVADFVMRSFKKTKNGVTKMLFISDIRTEPTMKEILKNQDEQANWIKLMKPQFSMIKFKMPYPEEEKNIYYKYLYGDLRLQVWAPVASAETRLIISAKHIDPTNDKFIEGYYDTITFERKLAYYNYLRQYNFNNAEISFLNNTKLIDFWSPLVQSDLTMFNIDFYNELLILKQYYDYFYINQSTEKEETEQTKLYNFLTKTIQDITYELNRTDRNVSEDEKRILFKLKKYEK